MKKLIIILCLYFSFSCFCIAEVNHMLPDRTTDKEILFIELPWGSEKESACATVYGAFQNIDSSCRADDGPSHAYSFHDYPQHYIPVVESENAVGTTITFKDRLGGESDGRSIGIVGGHPVESITLWFLENENYGLYKASYDFLVSRNDSIPSLSRYEDIKDKLTKLYGNPYTSAYEDMDLPKSAALSWIKQTSIWIGSNDSAIILSYDIYVGGLLSGDSHLRLEYGTTRCNDVFLNADKAAKASEDERIQKEIDSISDNNYGL